MKFLRPVNFTTALHILIWVLLLAIPTFLFPNKSFFGLSKFFFFITSIYHIGIFYLHAFLLYPKLLTKKRWWLYILSMAAVIIFSYHMKVYLLKLSSAFQPGEENKRLVFFGLMSFFKKRRSNTFH